MVVVCLRLPADVAAVFRDYPRIYFACHRRHVRDPKSGKRVSAHQVSILDHLDAETPTMLGDLAGHMGVTPATMSIASGRLVRQGHVTRVLDPVDRRKVQLRLTDAGCASVAANSVLRAHPRRRTARAAVRSRPPRGAARTQAARTGRPRRARSAESRNNKRAAPRRVMSMLFRGRREPSRRGRPMKWFLVIAGVLVGLVIVVAVVGAPPPRDHVATVSAQISASPTAV